MAQAQAQPDPSAFHRTGPLAALAIPAFRALWTAQLISNIGTWMQSVAAQWVLVDLRHAALLTSLVQAATLLPVLLLSLPAGVLSDSLDRRRYLLVLQIIMTTATGALALLQWAGLAGPAVLLGVTFILGCAAAMAGPAWQAIQPDLVPRQLLPPALALNGANVNLARAIGPALAGGLLAWIGPAAVFGINAATTVVVVVTLARWREQPSRTSSASMASAVRAGLRYVRSAPAIRRILLRSGLFVVPGSALWSLLAVASRNLLGLGSAGYGVGLAALGVGAVVGAVIGPKICIKLPMTAVLAGATVAFAAGICAVAMVEVPAVVWAVLVVAGIGWVVVLTVLQTGLQLTLPAWVRARGASAYILVFMGGQGLGAVVWGSVANWLNLTFTLLVAAGLLLAGAVTLMWWPLMPNTGQLDRTPQTVSPPNLPTQPAPDDGPIHVRLTYKVPAANLDAFDHQARRVELSRRRMGAQHWTIWQDLTNPEQIVEQYTIDTWGEYLDLLSERITGFDSELAAALTALASAPPKIEWFAPPQGWTQPPP
ncbi:MAG: MFS transporter [Bifidobacteriaceae bacterium]|jgi:MFS family permease|nr:MFS transporter [Bifidobacteriaceae bacterium]